MGTTEPERERDSTDEAGPTARLHACPETEALDLPVMSAQALRLHLLGCALSDARGSAGVIGRSEAELLADRTGSLVSEVVDAGLWIETDLAYVIRSRTGS